MLDDERKELEQRLADLSLLERALYPAIADVADGLGVDCVVSPKHDKGTQCYDTFRVTALKDDKPQCFIDVKFASATATGDYKVSLVSSEGTTIEHEMVGRPDLIDTIEGFIASTALKTPSESKKQEGADGFAHTWELQAQQAKETLEELFKELDGTDRLDISIHNYPHRRQCDTQVSVDNDPVFTVEFEGGTHGGVRWHCFEDEVDDFRLHPGDENGARDAVLKYREDILDALASFYGFGDEGV